MIDLDELITLKWFWKTKDYYKSKGYLFTKYGDEFLVKLKDLLPDSNQHITSYCDSCSKMLKVPYRNYNKIIEKRGIYMCKDCVRKENIENRTNDTHKRLYLLFLDKCDEHGATPVTTFEEFQGCYHDMKYICPIHGLVSTNMRQIASEDAWCILCGRLKIAEYRMLTPDEVKQRIESKNNNILLNPDEYIGFHEKNLNILCGSCNKQFVTSLSAINNGDGRCYLCGQEASLIHWQTDREYHYNLFKDMCDESGYILLSPQLDYINCYTKLRYVCATHGELHGCYTKFKQGCRCPECGNESAAQKQRLSTEEIKRRINVNGNVLLNPLDYIKNDVANLQILCACGNVFTTSLVNYEIGAASVCPTCSKKMSSGERLIKELLDYYKVEYITLYKFDDCRDKRPLPFDFYLPEFNYAIEFDGQLHFEPIYGEEQLAYTQKHDKMKNEYCENNNINIIRIPYWESKNIENILTSKLGVRPIKLITYPINKLK